MKILALVTDAYGSYGGIAQYNMDLLDGLSSASFTRKITVLPRLGDVSKFPSCRKLDLRSPTHGRLAYGLRAIVQAVLVRPDVIFCGHLYHGKLCSLLAKLTNARLVSQLHGTEVWQQLPERHLQPLRKSDLVLCVSNDTKKRYLAQLSDDHDNAAVLHNTVGADFTPGDRAEARRKFGIGDTFAISTVGRLDARNNGYKGHERVMNAIHRLETGSGKRIVYLIAGVGDDLERLTARAEELGIQDRVRFLGKVAHEDLPDLYRASDLFALPSEGEGFGIVFLEAMACGTPAIGLNVGGSPDALCDGELGICVSPEDFDSALQKAVMAPKRSREGLYLGVTRRFGKDVFRARVASLFGNLSGKKALVADGAIESEKINDAIF